MTTKEKAKELFDKFEEDLKECDTYLIREAQKRCALIAVDEILNTLDSDRIIYGSSYRYEESDFWNEVKTEIENL